MTQVTPAAGPADPEEIQRRIRRYRERLLDGRGPGASPQETAPQMRDRRWLGGVDGLSRGGGHVGAGAQRRRHEQVRGRSAE